MKLFSRKATEKDFDELRKEFWELKDKFDSVCKLLGIAFGNNWDHEAFKIEKDKK